ncbi:MAG TPA: acyl-CoA dehydrogenase family protein [Frankiaceae bacterium]|nr:acyl-CoA dehydrogenase family protein [Frankiaceae bacterium]
MDLSDSPVDAEFRTEFRAWLEANLPAEWGTSEFWMNLSPAESFALRREWEADKAREGFAGINWPKEFGGRGGTPTQKAIYDEEMARADAPVTVNTLGLTFLGPTVMAIGSDEQKRDIIKPMLHNEVIWCQGFSEPGAGSDLASLTTRATDAGDHWVVNGQKVWTTNALHADRMFALVRTDPQSQRHRGISMLLIDMHAEGVDARPLKQMTGNEEFGEVFLTDVKVPKDAVLGEVGAGWNVAMLLLSFERGSSAIGQYTRFRAEWEAVAKVARDSGRSKDPALRQRLADALVNLETLRLHSLHILTKVEKGEQLGFESSMTKLQWSETHQDLGEIYMDVRGYAGQQIPGLSTSELDPLTELFLWSRSETIWGGSSQVQRNIVAEHVLGLPR